MIFYEKVNFKQLPYKFDAVRPMHKTVIIPNSKSRIGICPRSQLNIDVLNII